MKNQTIKTVLLALAIFPLALFRALVLAKMWLWYIVPLGAIEISLPHAYGIGLLFAIFKGFSSRNTTYDEAFRTVVINQLAVFSVGYLVHLYFM
jgi:hypothetical protein